MCKIKSVSVAIMLFTITTLLQAQSGTNSPYTRFGYGDINPTAYSASRAMGGIGIGYRAKNTINPINPASFSNIDTLTFMFDLGASAKYTEYKTGSETGTSSNGNFDYMNMLFPVTKWLGMSIGMNPYSIVGYNFSSTDSLLANTDRNPTDETIVAQQTFEGSGGLNEVYAGISAKYNNHLSLGINASFLFGNITHNQTNILTSTAGFTNTQQNNLYIHDFRFKYGIQYFTALNAKNELTVGLIYENKNALTGKYEFMTSGGGSSDTTNTNYGFEFPNTYGVGFYFTHNKKISIGLDYSLQEWGSAKYYGETDTLSNVTKLALGVEYLPNSYSKKFYQRVKYRLGANLSNSYLKIDDKFNNYALTLGFGVPMRKNRSELNIGFEYGQSGEYTGGLIQENYYKITLSSTFIEKWFTKNVIR